MDASLGGAGCTWAPPCMPTPSIPLRHPCGGGGPNGPWVDSSPFSAPVGVGVVMNSLPSPPLCDRFLGWVSGFWSRPHNGGLPGLAACARTSGYADLPGQVSRAIPDPHICHGSGDVLFRAPRMGVGRPPGHRLVSWHTLSGPPSFKWYRSPWDLRDLVPAALLLPSDGRPPPAGWLPLHRWWHAPHDVHMVAKFGRAAPEGHPRGVQMV